MSGIEVDEIRNKRKCFLEDFSKKRDFEFSEFKPLKPQINDDYFNGFLDTFLKNNLVKKSEISYISGINDDYEFSVCDFITDGGKDMIRWHMHSVVKTKNFLPRFLITKKTGWKGILAVIIIFGLIAIPAAFLLKSGLIVFIYCFFMLFIFSVTKIHEFWLQKSLGLKSNDFTKKYVISGVNTNKISKIFQSHICEALDALISPNMLRIASQGDSIYFDYFDYIKNSSDYLNDFNIEEKMSQYIECMFKISKLIDISYN